MNVKKFLRKFGHIRPLMYSISSKNFSENLNKYFPKKNRNQKDNNKKKLYKKLSKRNIGKVNNLIKKHYSYLNFKSLKKITIEAIEEREYSKFIFSKCINEIFNNLIKLGKELNIEREDLEYIDIKTIKDSYNNLGIDKFAIDLKRQIQTNKKDYLLSCEIPMPDFISKSSDIYEFETSFSKGNFFTNYTIVGDIVEFDPKKNFIILKTKYY